MSKIYDNSQWQNLTQNKSIAVYQDMSLPTDTFNTTGNNIIKYSITGNSTQSGTPTPSNPISITGVGDKTINLLDKIAIKPVSSATIITQIDNGINVKNVTFGYGGYTPTIYVKSNTTYYIKFYRNVISGNDSRVIVFAGNSQSVILLGIYNRPGENEGHFNTGEYNKINIWFYAAVPGIAEVEFTNIMLNEGSTTLPYVPGGHRIPITLNNNLSYLYLGYFQTTRYIKKIIFSGNENTWYTNNDLKYMAITNPLLIANTITCYCTHFNAVPNVNLDSNLNMNEVCIRSNAKQVWIKYSGTLDEFKAWLKEQYTNNTPVTLYYVLSTPEIVYNSDPLMKIGTYADYLEADVSYPTNTGSNNITVETTAQPSNFAVTWTEWNNGQNTYKYTNNQWVIN